MTPSPAQQILRRVRLALATIAFLAFLLAASGVADRLVYQWHVLWLVKTGDGVMAVQAGPALLRCVASFSLGALATVLGLCLVTALAGRFFCAVLCPLGIWQDVVGRLVRRGHGRRRRRVREEPEDFSRRGAVERFVRYAVAGLCFGGLAAGTAAGFLALDPYTNAYRGALSLLRGPFLCGAVVPLAVVTALAAWRGRLFCTALCPVGTALGLLSRAAPLRIRMNDACVKCGACAAVCPSHCIDVATGTVDNERCVRCLACVGAFKVRGIECSARRGRAEENVSQAFSPSRRAFLKGGATLVAGLAAGALLAKTGMRRVAAVVQRTLGILPPGAGSPDRFAAKCTGCLRCVGVCTGQILKPAPNGLGPVRVDLSKGACSYDCHRCAEACPTGAIRRMPREEKQRTRIAQVDFHPDHCVVFQTEEWCGLCAGACPTGALSLRSNGTPKVSHPERCIGCGACQRACPGWHADDDPPDAFPKAMRVIPLPDGVQSLTAGRDPSAIPDSPNRPTGTQP